MEEYLIDQYEEFGGIHKIYKFPNEYGASVVKNEFSYGHKEDLWELMEIKFYDETNYELTEDELFGWLNDEELNEQLEHIMKKKK